MDFIRFRRQCADFFLDVELARQGFDLENLALLKKHLKDHEAYISSVAGKAENQEGVVDNKWQSALKVSSQKALRLVEDSCDP